MAKKRKEFSLNVGISSILFIFIILCLVSFAILSLSSAMSDYKLTSRVATNNTGYYEACNSAEDLLANFDKTLSDLYKTGISRTGFFEKVGKKKSFSVRATDLQTLIIELEINYPEKPGDSFYRVTSWSLETTEAIEYDDSLPVFK
jgi:hypothetical protein